jgi:hypothetical protein
LFDSVDRVVVDRVVVEPVVDRVVVVEDRVVDTNDMVDTKTGVETGVETTGGVRGVEDDLK